MPQMTLRQIALPTTAEGGPLPLADLDFRKALEEEILLPYVREQRWFQGKARSLKAVALADYAEIKPEHGDSVVLLILSVQYADGKHDVYAMPVKVVSDTDAAPLIESAPASVLGRLTAPGGSQGAALDMVPERILIDALADEGACKALYKTMVEDGPREIRRFDTAAQGALIASASTAAAAIGRAGIQPPAQAGAGGELSVRRLSAEQSNTSVIIGEASVLKLFRRLEEGENPDLEIGRFLTERTQFAHVPAVLGQIDYRTPTGTISTLAMLQQFIRASSDCWTYALELLQDYLDAAVATAEPAPAPDLPDRAAKLMDRLAMAPSALVERLASTSLQSFALLGRRTGELHLALASDAQDPAFAPEPVDASSGPGYVHSLGHSFVRQARTALDLLSGRLSALGNDSELRAKAAKVMAEGGWLMQRFASLTEQKTGAMRIRCHGDYHLGQVLRHGSDFQILDFEGEPLRSLRERRDKACALKDVAGMLRSFGYAAHTGRRQALGRHPGHKDTIAHFARAWEAWVSLAFLRSYLEAAAGAVFLPADPAVTETLLDAFMLDKAFYELQYELNNRPDWVEIPLDGILSIAARSTRTNGKKQT